MPTALAATFHWKQWTKTVCAIVILVWTPSTIVYADHRSDQSGKSYSFAAIPQFEQRRLFRIWRPILDELEKQTGLSFEFIGTAKIPTFEQKFMDGKFDFAYYEPPPPHQGRAEPGLYPSGA